MPKCQFIGYPLDMESEGRLRGDAGVDDARQKRSVSVLTRSAVRGEQCRAGHFHCAALRLTTQNQFAFASCGTRLALSPLLRS